MSKPEQSACPRCLYAAGPEFASEMKPIRSRAGKSLLHAGSVAGDSPVILMIGHSPALLT